MENTFPTIEKVVLVPHHKSLEWSKHQASLSGLDVIETLPNLHALVVRMKQDEKIETPTEESEEWTNILKNLKPELLS